MRYENVKYCLKKNGSHEINVKKNKTMREILSAKLISKVLINTEFNCHLSDSYKRYFDIKCHLNKFDARCVFCEN